MKSKISTSRIVSLFGIDFDERIVKLNVNCVRKNIIRSKFNNKQVKSLVSFLRSKSLIGMVSHPTVCRSKTAEYVNGWCHPFRNCDEFLKKPNILLSESDFVDPIYIDICNDKKKKWDFFCFTMGGFKNRKRKGTKLLIKCLDFFCIKNNMKGVLINYSNKDLFLFENEKKILNECCRKLNLKYYKKKFSSNGVAELMSKSKIGLFPNKLDCSPLLISESLVRNVPVLVNKNILGGWKYINNFSGAFFDENNLEESANYLINNKFCPRDNFLSNYGFKKSSLLFAEWGRSNFKEFENIRACCFSGLSKYLNSV